MLDLAPDVREVLTSKLLTDFGFFVRWTYKTMYGRRFEYAPHIDRIVRTMESVARGDITRLIINMPPRYAKTEVAVKMFMDWSLANNPNARFMHLSYSDSLVTDNSDAVRDCLKSDFFRELFPDTVISRKTDAKDKWYTTKGGGLYAVSTGAPITGFGAGIKGERVYTGTGSPADGFGGAIIIDDPHKADDAKSDIARERVNSRYMGTIDTRKNDEKTPVIVIMQRLHDHDMSGFLLGGGSGEKWDHLVLKAVQDDGTPLWPTKHSIDDLERKREADPEMFASQYQQSPMVATGNIFRKEWFRYYDPYELPTMFDRVFQSWDLTFKKAVHTDYVCGTVWGKKGADFYLLDMVHEKMSFTESLRNILQMTQKYPSATAKYIEEKANGDAVMDVLREKVSGIIPVVPRESKLARAHAVTPLFQAGNVRLPRNAPWIFDYEDEMTKFPNASHDDIVDSTTQGLSQEMQKLSIWDVI